ncbi:hypothetical protein KKC1_11420 [Calderihabitans maritimus]|uniref:Uncharacterized protein n=1 Tax=Calderihabitans maritimus TaxID=1246530 RepID=A0A1Z5HR16_9FIRM|nr:hypothetical protein KKC1_11420 [Calderihabitans maritimus]
MPDKTILSLLHKLPKELVPTVGVVKADPIITDLHPNRQHQGRPQAEVAIFNPLQDFIANHLNQLLCSQAVFSFEHLIMPKNL